MIRIQTAFETVPPSLMSSLTVCVASWFEMVKLLSKDKPGLESWLHDRILAYCAQGPLNLSPKLQRENTKK